MKDKRNQRGKAEARYLVKRVFFGTTKFDLELLRTLIDAYDFAEQGGVYPGHGYRFMESMKLELRRRERKAACSMSPEMFDGQHGQSKTIIKGGIT